MVTLEDIGIRLILTVNGFTVDTSGLVGPLRDLHDATNQLAMAWASVPDEMRKRHPILIYLYEGGVSASRYLPPEA